MSYAALIRSHGPVGYWRLGELSGTQATDRSGNGRHGTYTGGVTLGQSGAISDGNKAAGFAAGIEHVNIDNHASLQLVGDLTIECWLYVSSLTAHRVVVCKHYDREFDLVVLSFGRLALFHGSGPGTSEGLALCDDGLIVPGRWYHVVITRTASPKQVHSYINGAFVRTVAYTSTVVSGTNPVRIGRRTDDSFTFDGTIDEVALYNRALSASEIRQHYEARLDTGLDLQLILAGTDRTAKWQHPDSAGAWRFARMPGGRSPATFVLYDTVGAAGYRPALGDGVELQVEGEGVYAGEVTDSDETGLTESDTGVTTTITVADKSALAEQALITATFAAGTTIKSILQTLLSQKLTARGITLDGGQADGPTLTGELVYQDAPAATILNDLQAIHGWIWRVSPTGVLSQKAPASVSSGLSLSLSSGNEIVDNVSIQRTRSQNYADKIILYIGEGTTELEGKTLTGNGTSIIPMLNLSVYRLDSIHIPSWVGGGDDGWRPVGPAGSSLQFTVHQTGSGWELHQNSGTPVSNGATIELHEYFVNWPYRLEAGTGPVEKVVHKPDLFDLTLGATLASALLTQAMAEPDTVRVSYRGLPAWPGETVSLTFPERAINATYMVLEAESANDVDGALLTTLTCLEGSSMQSTWLDYFKTLSSGGGGGGGSTVTGSITIVEGGTTGGTGTAGTLAKWTGATTLGDSLISELGSVATVSGSLTATGVLAGTGGVTVGDSSALGWGDAMFWRAASGTIEMRNGATAFMLRPYNAYTDASNYERALVGWTANTFEVGTEQAGSGATRSMRLKGRDTIILATTLVDRWTIGSSGHLSAAGALNITTSGILSVPQITTGATTDLDLNPTGLIQTSKSLKPDTGYTRDIGVLTNKYRTVWAAELAVETLVAQDVMATIGGRILVGPTTHLIADLTAGATTFDVKHNNLENGDRVRLEAGGNVEWIAVASTPTTITGGFRYTITRNLDGSGANAWSAGDAVFNTGTTGDGFIDLYSTAGVFSGSGPTIAGNVRTGTTYHQVDSRWAIGNLNGLFGYGPEDTYGAAFGDPSNAWIKIDPTNGVRIGHNTTTKISLDASGNASFTGSITAAAGTIGGFTIGSTTLGATNLLLTSGAANAAHIAVGTSTNTAGMNSANAATDIAFWAGATHANRATAPFRVQADGVMKAASGSVTIDGTGIVVIGAINGFTQAGSYRFAPGADDWGVYANFSDGGPTYDVEVRSVEASAAGSSSVALVATNGSQTATLKAVASSAVSSSHIEVNCGISFPATQVASTGANTLDDYEETSWTPTLASSGGGAPTYTTRTGRAVKVGKLVTFWTRITLATAGTLAAGNLTITGLPFTAENTAEIYGNIHVQLWANMATSVVNLNGWITFNTSTITLLKLTAAATTNVTTLTFGDITGTFDIIVSGHYIATQ
jgi:Concanavalin A-like lectin/glucanases superfamily